MINLLVDILIGQNSWQFDSPGFYRTKLEKSTMFKLLVNIRLIRKSTSDEKDAKRV